MSWAGQASHSQDQADFRGAGCGGFWSHNRSGTGCPWAQRCLMASKAPRGHTQLESLQSPHFTF